VVRPLLAAAHIRVVELGRGIAEGVYDCGGERQLRSRSAADRWALSNKQEMLATSTNRASAAGTQSLCRKDAHCRGGSVAWSSNAEGRMMK